MPAESCLEDIAVVSPQPVAEIPQYLQPPRLLNLYYSPLVPSVDTGKAEARRAACGPGAADAVADHASFADAEQQLHDVY